MTVEGERFFDGIVSEIPASALKRKSITSIKSITSSKTPPTAMTDLGRRIMQGIVSELPKERVQATPPNVATSNVVNIPEFMKKQSIVISQEYAERQARLYEHARLTRWQKFKRKLYNLFFEL